MQDITDILARGVFYLYFSFLRFQMQDCPPMWQKQQSDVYNLRFQNDRQYIGSAYIIIYNL